MILPLARKRKIGVMAYFPFDRGRERQDALENHTERFRTAAPETRP
jgi:aryl-alcohol dehydrogenase-like predicted oxidoreductase